MSSSSKKSVTGIVFRSMGWPVFWGALLTIGFYALLQTGIVQSPLMKRYFANHLVQYVEAGLFFIGLSAIAMHAMQLVNQFSTLHDIDVVPIPPDGQDVTEAVRMLDSLAQLPRYVRRSLLARRLEDALQYVSRKGCPTGLDDELKHLSDLDASRMHDCCALVRIIIWATPMLGFLGTVIGITLALADLSPQALVSTPETAMQGLLSGLSIAFDTTALALVLSIGLMFAQHLTTSVSAELLEAVDRRANAELVGRFKHAQSDTAPHLGSINLMSARVIENMETLVARQAELWKGTLDAAHCAWNETTRGTCQRLEDHFDVALRNAVHQHVRELTKQEELIADRVQRQWQRLEEALNENAHLMHAQQAELTRQGDSLLNTLRGINQLSAMQGVLDRSLDSLSLANKLDETVMSLAAAINLLNARLTNTEVGRSLRVVHDPSQERVA